LQKVNVTNLMHTAYKRLGELFLCVLAVKQKLQKPALVTTIQTDINKSRYCF